jgi:microsomal dipeptidase-like Zn-dependent dipeptidase
MNNQVPPHWQTLHRQATVADLHAHPSIKVALFRRNLSHRHKWIPSFFWPLTIRSGFPQLQDGGVDVLLSAVYAPEKEVLNDFILLRYLRYLPFSDLWRLWDTLFEPSYFDVTTGLLDQMEQQVKKHNQSRQKDQRQAAFAHSVADLERILNQGAEAPIALIHSVEGAHCLQSKGKNSLNGILDHLTALFERGVALLTLAHFYRNCAVTPVFPYPEPVIPLIRPNQLNKLWNEHDLTQGLSDIGEQVVRRMFEMGMIVDISHCTPAARRAIYKLADDNKVYARVVATHVGAYAINPTPYNLEDWEIQWIADHGGVVGVIFMDYWIVPYPARFGLDFIAHTVEHLVKVAGGRTEHVALGTDFDGFTDPPDDLKDASELPRLTQRLVAELESPVRRRYTDTEVENILGRNVLRVLRQGWGRAVGPAE